MRSATHDHAKSGGVTEGDVPFAQRCGQFVEWSKILSVAHFIGGGRACPEHWYLRGLSGFYMAIDWPRMWVRARINAMQREQDKSPQVRT